MPGPFLPTSIANAAKKKLADVGRRIPLPDLPDLDVPNPFESAGSVAKEYGGALFSGLKYPLNAFAFSPYEKGWGDIVEQSADQSAVGRTAFDALDIATAPATIGSAFLGPAETAGFKTLPRIARWPLNVAAPASKSANFGTRLAAETAIGTAGSVAGQETAERTDNPFLIGGVGLLSGVAASGAVSAGMRRAKPKPSRAPAVVDSTLPDVSDPVRSLIKRVGEAKPLQEQNKELLTQFHGRQAGSFEQALGPGESGFRGAMSAMQGQAERIGFEPLRPSLGQDGVDALFDSLKEARLQTFDHVSAGAALRDILDGRVPVDSELKKLELAFPGVTDSLRKAKIIAGPGPGAYLSDGMNAVMSLKSGLDISGLRQTATAAYGHPVMFGKAFKKSLQSFASEDSYNQVLDDLNHRWYKDFRDEAGVMLNTSERAITRGEGTIIARTVNRIPGYRASNRAYTSLVNLMRDGVFADMLEGTGVNPKDIPLDELKRMGRLANVSTGRGSLPKFIADSQVANTPVFWAPRLVMSRFEMPFEVLSKSPVVRKEAARQLAAFVGVNGTILGLLKASGAADVEADPRSADFGQVRLGNQRIDPWFGFRPVANLVARLATGERKSTTTGAVSDVEAKQILSDFLRQKFSPLTQVGVNLYNGENAVGEPYGLKDVPEDAFLSLFLSDLKEAVKTGGVGDIPAALPSVLGFGTNAYRPNLADTEDYGALTGEDQFKMIPAQAWLDVQDVKISPDATPEYAAKVAKTRAEVEQYGNISKWHDETIGKLLPVQLAKAAKEFPSKSGEEIQAVAQIRAEAEVDRDPLYKSYLKAKDALETEWYKANKDEARKYVIEQLKKPEFERKNMPTQAQLEIIFGRPVTGGTKSGPGAPPSMPSLPRLPR